MAAIHPLVLATASARPTRATPPLPGHRRTLPPAEVDRRCDGNGDDDGGLAASGEDGDETGDACGEAGAEGEAGDE